MRETLSVEVGHREPRLRRPEVDPSHEPMARVERHERRAPAAARRPGPEVLDEPDPDEIGDEAADGRSGQTGRVDELRAREGLRALDDHGQHALQVLLPQVPGAAAPGLGARPQGGGDRRLTEVHRLDLFGRESK
jgi:hypothetical protein